MSESVPSGKGKFLAGVLVGFLVGIVIGVLIPFLTTLPEGRDLISNTLEPGWLVGDEYPFLLKEGDKVNIHIEVKNHPPLEFEVYWTDGETEETHIEREVLTVYDNVLTCPKDGDYIFKFVGGIRGQTEAYVKIYVEK